MIKKENIPIHNLTKTDDLGIHIRQAFSFDTLENRAHLKDAHRDEHYIFIVQNSGSGKLMVDFKEICLQENTIFHILPGQIHYGISNDDFNAWFIAIDNSLIKDKFKTTLEEQFNRIKPIPINKTQKEYLNQIITLLNNIFSLAVKGNYYSDIILSLVESFLGLFLEIVLSMNQPIKATEKSTHTITRKFKRLVHRNYKTIKAPSDYASSLNISPSYLNEVLKKTTGLHPTYWIHQEIITEAKRMLFYTDNPIKQIAYDLGYEDHAYFSRLFRKINGTSATTFRKTYRK